MLPDTKVTFLPVMPFWNFHWYRQKTNAAYSGTRPPFPVGGGMWVWEPESPSWAPTSLLTAWVTLAATFHLSEAWFPSHTGAVKGFGED